MDRRSTISHLFQIQNIFFDFVINTDYVFASYKREPEDYTRMFVALKVIPSISY